MKFAITGILLSTFFSLHAQINAGHPDDHSFHVFEGGFALGINASQVDGDLIAGFNKLGLNTGPVLDINFSQNWFLSMELLFTQKGSRSTLNDNLPYTLRIDMDYIEVPVLMNYNDKQHLIFQAGLAYGRLFKVQQIVDGIVEPNSGAFYNSELSYVLGGTFLIGKNRHFGANIRYQGSITSVGKSSNPKTIGLANRLLSFRALYYF